MVNAQEWLEDQEEYNTKEKREQITRLKTIVCCDNYLTNFDYSSLNPDKLTYSIISDNKFHDSGWEYLPASVEYIYCSSEKRPENFGFQPEDYGFACYLTKQGYTPQSELDLEGLRTEYYDKSQKNQEWLKKYYPDKGTERIDINQQLEGVLDCREYKNLYRIFISTSVDRSKFEIKGGSYEDWRDKETKETKITPCILAQEYINQNYPKNGTCVRIRDGETHEDFGKIREEIKELDIREKALEGELDLSDFKNLEILKCSDNYLTQIPYLPNPEKMNSL
ncbi:7228_t:CDS:2 [Scutellospora calospora]|uniref:7228_t:CDS:1 n=1 Tax=Scutellospora calospora TaxID=85575 RepID=A0ACA9K6Y9_9GLOM|nr:7228_t:CDS:2 [Scutellospora calospora]